MLQRRSTDANGNTLWAETPLVTAARMGRLCVLDGLDRLPTGLLAPLLRLLLERELALFDGRCLVSAARHAKMCSDLRLSAAQLRARGIERIHPSFRVVALAATFRYGWKCLYAVANGRTAAIVSLFLYRHRQ